MPGYAAFGTVIQKGDGADPEVFTDIGGVRNIGGPAMTVDTVDITAHDSPGGFEELVSTIKRTGDLPLEMVYDPADTQIQALKTEFDNRTTSNYKITMVDEASTEVDFAALVTGFELSFPFDGAMMINITLKPTGNITGI